MNIQEGPLVSVLTPVYNMGSFLAECMESVLCQTYKNIEYVVINNCSTDRTLEVALEYARKDSRVRVHNNDRFVGVIENHNSAFGLMSPSAKYCKVVSADDFIFPDCLTKMVGFAEANPSVGIVGSYPLCGDIVKCQGFPYPKAVFSGAEVCRYFFLRRQSFVEGHPVYGFGAPTSILYRADLVRNSAGRFYPNSSPHADTSACFEQLQNSCFGFVYQILSFERTHQQTQSAGSTDLNRYSSAVLSDLINYGPLYLNQKELDRCLKACLAGYHRYLAVEYFVGFRNQEFWTYHESRLKELGYPLTRLALLKAGAFAILEGLPNPGEALRKLRLRLPPNWRGSVSVVESSEAASSAPPGSQEKPKPTQA